MKWPLVFKKNKKNPSVVVASLNARLQPVHRGELEDALDAVMKRHGHGVRVLGGGTLLQSNGEVEHCDIEIELDHLSDVTIDIVVRALEAMLAPKGSRLHVPDQNRVIEFGAHEGLALYLNGTDLPQEVYATSDVNFVYQECERLLSGIGIVKSHWQGQHETALYMYGSDFQTMRDCLTSFLQTYPLCQQCRIEQIA
ncbi:hypothetical protein GHJ82_24180 [Sinorhizobium saheli]|uniref:Uncharacterized protein n=1 Tax=Sinorhizobium saheli TaxID=36856 RepID=A0A178YDP0_SINSA|nr:hypothetical protein [Sinorhizobium saheli]OAP45589.1 hypothetical protein ATB98_11080 [Sinorhizobium saheli]